MKAFGVKTKKIGATRYTDIIKCARKIFHDIEKKTKRRPHVRSAYFKKEKVFFDFFWTHLNQAPMADRRRRLRYFPCAIELMEKSQFKPTSRQNPNKKSETQYRFAGITTDSEVFYIQIKKNPKTGQLFLMSIFPPE